MTRTIRVHRLAENASEIRDVTVEEAEKIAIEHNLNDPQILLENLKKSPLWPS